MAGLNYLYSSNVVASDPTAGKLKFDSVDFTAITKFRISLTDADSVDQTTTVRGYDSGSDPEHRGYILVQKTGSPGDFVLFEVTAARVDNSGWEEFTIAFVQKGGVIANGDAVQAFRAGASSIAGNVTGRSAGLRFTYSNDVTATDPTAGKLKFDDADPSLATVLRISETDGDGNLLAALLASWDASTSANRATIMIYRDLAPGTTIFLNVTGARTDNGGWKEFPVSVIATNGVFNDGDVARLVFALTGDTGAAGGGGGGSSGGVGGFNFDYIYDSVNTSVAAPGSNTIRANNATLSSATILCISAYNDAGRGLADYFSHQATGNYIVLRNDNLADGSIYFFKVSGSPTNHTSWVEIPVNYVTNDGALPDGILNPGMLVSVAFSGPYA